MALILIKNTSIGYENILLIKENGKCLYDEIIEVDPYFFTVECSVKQFDKDYESKLPNNQHSRSKIKENGNKITNLRFVIFHFKHNSNNISVLNKIIFHQEYYRYNNKIENYNVFSNMLDSIIYKIICRYYNKWKIKLLM